MKKKLLILLLGVVLLTGCSNNDEPIVEADVNLKDEYTSVLLGNKHYIDPNGVEMDFAGYLNQFSNVHDYVPASYIFMDLNADGHEELLVSVDIDPKNYLVLHYEKKNIYGYYFESNYFTNVKEDGSFYTKYSDNSGAIQKLIFSKTHVTVRDVAKRDGNNYYYNGSAISANQYVTYFNEFKTKKDLSFTGSKTYSTKDKSISIYGTYYLLDKKGDALTDGSGTISLYSNRCDYYLNKEKKDCAFIMKKKKLCVTSSGKETCYTVKNDSLVKGTEVYKKSS